MDSLLRSAKMVNLSGFCSSSFHADFFVFPLAGKNRLVCGESTFACRSSDKQNQFRIKILRNRLAKRIHTIGVQRNCIAAADKNRKFHICRRRNCLATMIAFPRKKGVPFALRQIDLSCGLVFFQYLDATGDESFCLQAMEVYIETARFWYSRCIIHPDGSADLMFCKGPDEYCGITNNNLFTNCMVKFNLDLAIKAALKLKETDPNRYSKLSLSDEEVLAWHSLRDNLKECRNPQTGRYMPDETFSRLEPVDIKTLKTDDGASYHHVCFDRLQRYQVIKQADTLLLMSRLPNKFTPEERLNAWEDFEPCCLHDSTLSFASHALFAAQNGLQEAAEKYFKKALYLDLHEIMNNTGKEGLHLACLGETWSSIFFGFLGANFDGDTPVFSPALPFGWKALRMNFYWQGKIYHLAISDNHYTVTKA